MLDAYIIDEIRRGGIERELERRRIWRETPVEGRWERGEETETSDDNSGIVEIPLTPNCPDENAG